MVLYNISQRPEIISREARKIEVGLLLILSVGFIVILLQIIPSDDKFV